MQKNKIGDKTIYTCGCEAVALIKKDGVHYFVASSISRNDYEGARRVWHEEKVPENCFVDKKIDNHKLLEYIAKKYLDMCTMHDYR